ncbi:MAG: leucyl aminopeptidase [Bacillaceae bacterium]|nr:leucyl aminopeptidase [Bacillaceae bacterium]
MKTGLILQDLSKIKTDCLIVGIVEEEEENRTILSGLGPALDGYLTDGIRRGDFSGKAKETAFIHTFGRIEARAVLLVGLGKKEQVDFEIVRDAAARAVKTALQNRVRHVVFAVPETVQDAVTPYLSAHAVVEGAYLSQYRFNGYKQKQDELKELDELLVVASSDRQDEVEKGIRSGAAFGRGTNLARDLVNTPGNLLPPSVLAEHAVEVAKKHGMEVEVLNENDMKKLKMGALLAVAQGSEQPPRMVVIKYQGRGTWDNVIGFVGKGITFDTGGISLKPVKGMEEMVGDMGGAAAVIGAMDVIGRLKPAVNIMAVIPMAENMPDGKAYRPGDVITSMSGKTIEILTTDAEGRLILADAITYARQQGVDFIVDLATLTGAVLVALGTQTTGVMANDEEWVEEVLEAAADAGELAWRLPTFDVYKKQYKGRVADLKNSGGRYAGSITAGMFLGEFAEDTPWVHLDIAGTSWQEGDNDLSPAGGTGVMVRTLARLAENCADEA